MSATDFPISASALFKREGGHCFYCQKPVSKKKAVREHRKPLIGCVSIAEVNANLAISHPGCHEAGAAVIETSWLEMQFRRSINTPHAPERKRFSSRTHYAKLKRRCDINPAPKLQLP